MTDEALASYRLEQLEARVEAQAAKVEKLEKEVEDQEHRRLKWGVGALGSVVLTLGSVLWSYRSEIFK